MVIFIDLNCKKSGLSSTFKQIILLSKLIKKRLVLNFHGDDLIPRSSLTKRFHFFVVKILKKTDLVVLPSLYFKNVLLNKFDFNTDKIFVSPSAGINTDYFNQNDKIFDYKFKM